jgi:hypothetical protein
MRIKRRRKQCQWWWWILGFEEWGKNGQGVIRLENKRTGKRTKQ